MRRSVSLPVLFILQRRHKLTRCAMFAGGQQQPLHSPPRLPCKRVTFKIGCLCPKSSVHKPSPPYSSAVRPWLGPARSRVGRPFIFDGDEGVICLGRIGLLVEKPVSPAGRLPVKANKRALIDPFDESRRRLCVSANRALQGCQKLPLERPIAASFMLSRLMTNIPQSLAEAFDISDVQRSYRYIESRRLRWRNPKTR